MKTLKFAFEINWPVLEFPSEKQMALSFDRLPDERGPGYKLAQGIQSKIVIPISEQIKKLGQKFFEFEALWDWTVSVSNAFGSVISAMCFFIDMYKDLILFFVFYHISRFIMVNKFGEIGGVNLEYIAW